MYTNNDTYKAVSKDLLKACGKCKDWEDESFSLAEREARFEYELLNRNTKANNVLNGDQIRYFFSRDYGEASGATKTTHLRNKIADLKGVEFMHIVIKRHKTGGYKPGEGRYDQSRHKNDPKWTGNQLIDEIRFYRQYEGHKDQDLLCPILRTEEPRGKMSGKKYAFDERVLEQLVIIAQKAIYTGSAEMCCDEAERLNSLYGYNGETSSKRYERMEAMSDRHNWRDALYNWGNSGVIFDLKERCYKAVFIDYGL